jgi:hypothetical protein
MLAVAVALTLSMVADTVIAKGGGGAFAVAGKLMLTGLLSGSMMVALPVVPDHVPVYGNVMSLREPGLIAQTPLLF